MITVGTIISVIGIIISIIIICYSYLGAYRDMILMKPLVRKILSAFIIKSLIIIILSMFIFTNKSIASFLINLLFFGFIMIYSIYYFLNDIGDSISEIVFRDALYLLAIIILVTVFQFHSGGNILISFLTQIIMIVFLGGYIIYKLPSHCEDIQHPKEGFTMASILSYLPLLIIFIIWYENKFYCINGNGKFELITKIGNTWIYTIMYYLILLGIYFGYMFLTKKVSENEDWKTFITDYKTWINTNSLLLLIPLFFPSFLYYKNFGSKKLFYIQIMVIATIVFSLILGNDIKIFS